MAKVKATKKGGKKEVKKNTKAATKATKKAAKKPVNTMYALGLDIAVPVTITGVIKDVLPNGLLVSYRKPRKQISSVELFSYDGLLAISVEGEYEAGSDVTLTTRARVARANVSLEGELVESPVPGLWWYCFDCW
jgi:hypothetical protein